MSRRPPRRAAVPFSERLPEAHRNSGDETRRSRRTAQQERHRRRMRMAAAALAGLAGLTAGAIYLNLQLEGADDRRSSPAAASGSALDGETRAMDTTLLFGTSRPDGRESPEVRWLSLLLLDEAGQRGAVLYIPAHTAAEVPGRGLLPLTDAYAGGRTGLLAVSVGNLLDVDIDRVAELSEEQAEDLFDATGPLTVEVPVEVRVGEGRDGARLLVPQGLQDLSSGGLVDLLYVVGLDSDDAELGSRHLAFWQAYLASLADDAEARAQALQVLDDLPVSEGSGESLGQVMASLSALPALERDLIVLPVEQAGTGRQELFEVDVAATRETLGSLVEGSFGEDEADGVQVLNGNGEPGVGAEVGEKLVKGGFRVVLSGNAPRLDYRKTLVITYDRTAEGLALAEEARDLLGVGQVQVAGQQQGIVDLTVVVGKDYLRQES